MVFSVNTIKESQTRTFDNNENKDNINYEDTNWFALSLEMVLQESIEFNNMISIDEGIGSLIAGAVANSIKNALKAISPYEILAKVFDWFVNSLATLGRHFEAFLLNFLNDDIELAAFKKKLANYRGAVRFTKPYYVYRNLSLSTSYTTYEAEIEREYDMLIKDLQEFRNIRTNVELANYVENMREMNMYLDSDIDKIRGKVLGSYKPITSGDYADELFLYFRTTSSPIDPSLSFGEKNISGERVQEAFKAYYNSSNQKAEIRRDIVKMNNGAKKEKQKVKSVKPEDYLTDTGMMDQNIVKVYNNVIINKCKKIQAVCDVYVMLFAAKLDAIKEYNVTNKLILLEACKEIVREG